MPHLKLSKSQYAELIRDIEDTLKKHMAGGGRYDFAAPETMEMHLQGHEGSVLGCD